MHRKSMSVYLINGNIYFCCVIKEGFFLNFLLNTWTWIALSGYEKYLIVLLNNINIWFFKPHNIWSREIELDCFWTIPLDIINYTKECGNILDELLTYVTMTCNTQSCTKSAVMWMEISSCINYQKIEL